MVYGTYVRTFINTIVKNKINFRNLLAATYHGWICTYDRLPPIILSELICPSDTENYVLFICYIIYSKIILQYMTWDLTNFMKFELIFIVMSAM